ncbi:MAG TPA: LysR family transcriptional regulator [Paracoccus sp. (in: a-proteobacteria)]|uniref:LysR family transcriptional regulator n=1 Tax=Paracoccus sp. TaxID=267 RepID=UPI002C4BC88C|nr:LysR family transcriptional regulator [Paracoccus sp. (in: a-proteobacteria)]HWL57297.1 LysR family transcriptional regulator [Paracoccus sp. (in: a-proteobacteria)]
MDLNSIATFNELVRSGSIRQAAEGLNTSPTAVVRQLDKLEHAFGTALVERSPRGIRLTAAGEVLAERARLVAREMATARRAIDDLRGLKRGSVSLHVPGVAASSMLAPALAGFSSRYPHIQIEVTVTSAAAAIEAAATGASEIAVAMFTPPDPRIEVLLRVPMRHDPVMAPGHPLAALDEVSLEDLLHHPLALPDRAFGVRRALDARIRARGLAAPEVAFTTASLELQKELACRGAAVMILPRQTVAREIGTGFLTQRPFCARDRIETYLELCRPVAHHQSRAARELSDFLVEYLSGLGAG